MTIKNQCCPEELIEQCKEILQTIEERLQPKFTTSKNKNNITSFFHDTNQVVKSIEQALPTNSTLKINSSELDSYTNLAEIFQGSIQVVLRGIPQENKNAAMKQLPKSFEKVINKIITHLKGDKSWLKAPNHSPKPEQQSSNDDNAFQLTLESDKKTSPPKQMPSKSSTINTTSKQFSDDLGYPLQYHKLSDKQELGSILDALFPLIYPKRTLVSSMKHCKQYTRKSLNVVSGERLGQNEDGNKTLYKILTDTMLGKIFKDDRIISALEQAINIPLLKLAISTALYRLRKNPLKFPILGGVSYFIDLEEDMLRSTNIQETLLELITTPRGAKGLFLTSANKERGGLETLLENNPDLYKKIILALPQNSKKAKIITDAWSIKFSGLIIRHSGINTEERDMFFSDKKEDDINQYIRLHNI